MASAECDLLSAAVEGVMEGVATTGSPYQIALLTCLGITIMVFIVSTLTRNYSQVDKLWSITPILYTWMAVVDARTLLMAVLVTVWGIRLTFNFHRRGGYSWPPWSGEEDYRWSYIQQGHFVPILANPVAWVTFNLTFISFYQNFLLLLITSPSFVAYTAAKECNGGGTGQHPLNMMGMDGLATLLVLLSILVESVADNQQYKFQTEKYRRINNGVERKGDYADGFCQSGLFSIVRKPNYAAEQSIWICFYLFAVAATGGNFLNWSLIGWSSLVMLFQGSGFFTEKLTLMKYPETYAKYQLRVPLYVPRLWRVSSKTNNTETQSLVSVESKK
mmetsp:Transcript_65695/g.77231  ORF Transcript_65695/g.77231 Transcript_65695/m.77231 type:complete len:332 (+) Transcript_65695:189-1184(+)